MGKQPPKESKIKKLIDRPREVLHTCERGLAYWSQLKKITSRRGEYIFIACMPKTASTFMTMALSELTGFTRVGMRYDVFNQSQAQKSDVGLVKIQRSEQDLYLPKVIDAYPYGTVTQQHVKATCSNLRMMKTFSIRPVVLVRNILDVVVSIRDHLYKEGFHKFPTFFCNKKFPEFDEKTQLDWIIELGLPWYFNFYVSWYEASSSKRIDVLWLTYEEVIADWKEALKKVLLFYGIQRTDEEIEKALNVIHQQGSGKGRKIRINKGVIGRGRATLTDAQRERIIGLARFYPSVDFSRIGI
jgi:hypothetical protein